MDSFSTNDLIWFRVKTPLVLKREGGEFWYGPSDATPGNRLWGSFDKVLEAFIGDHDHIMPREEIIKRMRAARFIA